MENVRDWIKNNSSGSGSVYGSGYGDGSGDGSGYGSGSVYGSGSGSGYGSGYGSGSVYGDGSGYGSGYGSGDGSGDGDGDGIGLFGDREVFSIDGVQTIIDHIKDSVAKGSILNSDLTLTPCFIVKGNGYFAHGKTISEATQSLREKIFEDMDPEESIEKFMDQFKKDKKYEGSLFFEWHHYLTGSCLMGRENFVKNKGLDLSSTYTVEEFISLCENDYGAEIIKQLKDRWKDA